MYWDVDYAYYFCQRNAGVLMRSDRKCVSLHLAEGESEQYGQVSSFIEKQKPTLVDFKIHQKFTLEPLQFFQMMSILSENLKSLDLVGVTVQIQSLGVLQLPNLEQWKLIEVHPFTFEGLRTPKLKRFTYKRSGKNNERPHSGDFVSFLRDQPQLEDLEIGLKIVIKKFVDDHTSTPFPFNLKRLELYGFNMIRCVDISPFLDTQRQSLKTLTLDRFAFRNKDLRIVLSLELEELELSNVHYHSITRPISRSLTIAKLSFSCKTPSFRKPNDDEAINVVINSCPNLLTLSIDGYDMTEKMARTIAFTKIKNLELLKTAFTFPLEKVDQILSLEKFTAIRINEDARTSFIAKNPQLRFIKTKLGYNNVVNDAVDYYAHSNTHNVHRVNLLMLSTIMFLLFILSLILRVFEFLEFPNIFISAFCLQFFLFTLTLPIRILFFSDNIRFR